MKLMYSSIHSCTHFSVFLLQDEYTHCPKMAFLQVGTPCLAAETFIFVLHCFSDMCNTRPNSLASNVTLLHLMQIG